MNPPNCVAFSERRYQYQYQYRP